MIKLFTWLVIIGPLQYAICATPGNARSPARNTMTDEELQDTLAAKPQIREVEDSEPEIYQPKIYNPYGDNQLGDPTQRTAPIPAPAAAPAPPPVVPKLDASKVSPSNVVLGGIKLAWEIIEKNQTVVNAQFNGVSVIPEGVDSWLQMQNWKDRKSKTYEVTFSNLIGVTVATFRYRILFDYGGNVNGVGQYLTNVQVMPTFIDVMLGWSFDASVVPSRPKNVGSLANPVAEVLVNVKMSAHSKLRYKETSASFKIRGDGDLNVINDET
jgi:hypothetical protein